MTYTEKEQKKDKYLQSKYGIDLTEYYRMLKEQNYSCKICKKHQDKFKNALHVDHDHGSGKVRGLLCYHCNRRIVGRHNPESVMKLVAYILPEYKLIRLDSLQEISHNKKNKRGKR